MAADGNGFSAVALGLRNEPDAAVAKLVGLPDNERRHSGAGYPHALQRKPRVVRAVFHGAEQRLGVGVVVADPWPGEGSEHTQLLQPALQRGRPHGVAVIGMKDQRVGPALVGPFPHAGPADEISGGSGPLPARPCPSPPPCDSRCRSPDRDTARLYGRWWADK